MNKVMLIAAGLLCLPLAAQAVPVAGDRELTLSGSGSSDRDFDNNSLGATLEYGVYFTDRTEVGIRQSFSVADRPGDTSWSGATRVYADYHFGGPTWVPYVGASVGGFYGEDIDETFAAGPELGVKYYVQPNTFILAQAEYQFLFDDADEVDDSFDDGVFLYNFGVGMNF